MDYDPPERYKCGCRSGYRAVLPVIVNVTDPVPVEWRPLVCVDMNTPQPASAVKE